MADTTTLPGAGHNSGALDLSLALDSAQLQADLTRDSAGLLARATELKSAYERFIAATAGGIPDEVTLAKAGDFVRQLAAHVTAIDARRTVVKRPVLEAQRIIDAHYKRDMADPLDLLKAEVLKRITLYQRKAQEKIDAERRAEAERQRAAAAALAAAAEAQASESLMDSAMEAEARAEVLAAPTAEPAPVLRSDLGTSIGTRKGPWKVRVVDIAKVPAAYLMANEPVLLATAKTDPRIAAGEQPVPGVEFYRETLANVR